MKKNKILTGRSLFFLLKTVISMGVLLDPMLSQANCSMSNDDKIELFLNPEKGVWGNFVGKMEIIPSSVTKCREDASKYLMLTLGVARPGLESNLKDVYIFDNYQADSCKLSNTTSMAGITADRLKEHFSQQFKLLRTCFELKVDDINGVPITYNEKQEHCRFRKSTDGGIYLSGDMCFLKINGRNQFSVLPVLKPECLEADFLKNHDLMPQDLEANLDVLVAGDDTGNSTNLAQIGSRALFLTVTPSPHLMPVSEDFGPENPRFPTEYGVDVDWGKVSIRPSSRATQINLSVLASNFGEKNCLNDGCVRTSNFVQPVFGQVEVFELKANKKPHLIEEWWDGGFAAANWQGYIVGMGYGADNELFHIGNRYRIDMTFQNPSDDYAIFLSGLSQMLINLSGFNNGSVGVATVPALETLKQIGVIPPFMGTSVLNGDDQSVNLGQVIKGLSGIITNRVWPTYFEQVCDSTKSSCIKIGKKKFFEKLSLEFTAGPIDPESGEMSLDNLTLQKESTVFKGYKKTAGPLPEITCGGH